MVVYISVTRSFRGIAHEMIIKKMFLRAARSRVFSRDPRCGKPELIFLL